MNVSLTQYESGRNFETFQVLLARLLKEKANPSIVID